MDKYRNEENMEKQNQEGGDPYVSDEEESRGSYRSDSGSQGNQQGARSNWKEGSSYMKNSNQENYQSSGGGRMENQENSSAQNQEEGYREPAEGRPMNEDDMEETAMGKGTSQQQQGTTGPSGNMQMTGAEGSGMPEGGTGMSGNTSSSSEEGGGHISVAQIHEYLRGVNFPAAKQDMIDTARSNNAPGYVMSFMNKLPEKTYESTVDVEEEYGKIS